MQTSPSRQEQDKRNQDQQKEAETKTKETTDKVEKELPTHPIDVERQNIEGRIQEIKGTERLGASKQEVAGKTEPMVGAFEYEISRNKPFSGLSLNRDTSGKEIELVKKKIYDVAEEVAKKREETLAGKVEAERKLKEQDRRSEIVAHELRLTTTTEAAVRLRVPAEMKGVEPTEKRG